MFSYPSIDPVYTNALLATLNARKGIRSSAGSTRNTDTDASGKVTLSLSRFPNPGSTQVGFFFFSFGVHLVLQMWLFVG
jgi:hypothetical protein